MTLRLYDVAFNAAFDRGELLEALALYPVQRILVPPRHAAEVQGMALLLGLPNSFSYVHWQYGSGCLDGWLVVIDPEIEHFICTPGQLPRLEPRK